LQVFPEPKSAFEGPDVPARKSPRRLRTPLDVRGPFRPQSLPERFDERSLAGGQIRRLGIPVSRLGERVEVGVDLGQIRRIDPLEVRPDRRRAHVVKLGVVAADGDPVGCGPAVVELAEPLEQTADLGGPPEVEVERGQRRVDVDVLAGDVGVDWGEVAECPFHGEEPIAVVGDETADEQAWKRIERRDAV
jgi:hypothetical protein